MPWPHIGAQLGLPDKGPAIKGLVLSAIVCCSMAKFNDLWDGSKDQRKVRGLVPCCCKYSYRVQVPQHPLDSYKI